MTSYRHPDLVALDTIEDLLEAYAGARLAPSGPVLKRMRKAVMAEAATLAVARAIDRQAGDTDVAPRDYLAWLPQLRVPRHVAAAGFAALLTIGTGAAVLAAPPGSPFFDARVAIEDMFLPAQIDDRLTAHEGHLNVFLAEARAAAARGDASALAAALAAYDAEVARTLKEIGEDSDRLVQLEAMLARHVAVLTALQAEVPHQASIDNALESSQKAIARIKEQVLRVRPSHAPGGPPEGRGRP